MNKKLPPPYIESSIPAQVGDSLKIPFRYNRAMSMVEATTMCARVKNVVTDQIVATIQTDTFANNISDSTYLAVFGLDKVELTIGQYYKIQLAFTQLGYYSTVGIFKYTAKPQVTFDNLDEYDMGNIYTYTGIYSQEGLDPTEKVYSYRFDLYKDEELYLSSGTLLHDSSADTAPNTSSDTWVLNQQLQSGVVYLLTYSVTTANGLTASCTQPLMNNEIDMGELYHVYATNNYDSGYISVRVVEDESEWNKTRGFILSRASSKDNYGSWNEIMKFTKLPQDLFDDELWRDYTVEQGVGYRYAIQRYNKYGFYSAQTRSADPVVADFEGMFLYDGERQLKIRLNPQVSSFKNTILETKTDTVGGKYPFIFRNGNVKYKELPISGMISYWMDENWEFAAADEIGLSRIKDRRSGASAIPNRSTQLTAENITAERNFKLKVLDWLGNGKMKLFRSPTEGNYIVRLMNISLSPNDTLGRMLHNFSSTAYEIAEFSFDNLLKYNFINETEIKAETTMEVKSISLANKTGNYLSEQKNGVYMAEFIGVQPGTLFTLRFAHTLDDVTIAIPFNGRYKINIADIPLMSVELKELAPYYTEVAGQLDIGYYVPLAVDNFNEIVKIKMRDKFVQLIGADSLTLKENCTVDHVYFLRVETKADYTDADNTELVLNGTAIEIDPTGNGRVYEAYDLGPQASISIGSGLIADIMYREKEEVKEEVNVV